MNFLTVVAEEREILARNHEICAVEHIGYAISEKRAISAARLALP